MSTPLEQTYRAYLDARLWFDCTPARKFAGIAPTVRRVQFAEHVFYRFRDGRIEHVWSLIDTAAVRDQLT